MKRFYCKCCDLFLHEHECKRDVEFIPSEAWGQQSTTRFNYHVCGVCGSDVEEVHVCKHCANALPAEGSDNCAPCDTELHAEEQLIVSMLTPLRGAA